MWGYLLRAPNIWGFRVAIAVSIECQFKVDGGGGSNNETNNTDFGDKIVNKKAAAVAAVTVTPASSRLQTTTTDTSVKNYKFFCRLVLAIILVLIGVLCSVFIKPELYFSQHGKNFYYH